MDLYLMIILVIALVAGNLWLLKKGNKQLRKKPASRRDKK
jgi:hypothetical protein